MNVLAHNALNFTDFNVKLTHCSWALSTSHCWPASARCRS